MKKTFYSLLFIAVSVLCIHAEAQTAADSVRTNGVITISQTDAIPWMKRYQADIDKYVAENKTLKDRSCDALFLGSSSINLWHNIYNDLAPLHLIRRSYGGATLRDMLYNYKVIASGYRPKQIVIYVENDLCGCSQEISVGKVYDLFRLFVQKLQKEYPGIPVYMMAFKPSVARTAELAHQIAINNLLSDYARETKNLYFLDITKGMYDASGKLDASLFGPDGLHMTQKGYDIWTAQIKPILMKNAGK